MTLETIINLLIAGAIVQGLGLVAGLVWWANARAKFGTRLAVLEHRYRIEAGRGDRASREALRDHEAELRAAGHSEDSPDMIAIRARLAKGA